VCVGECLQPNKRLKKKLPKHCEVANILVGEVRYAALQLPVEICYGFKYLICGKKLPSLQPSVRSTAESESRGIRRTTRHKHKKAALYTAADRRSTNQVRAWQAERHARHPCEDPRSIPRGYRRVGHVGEDVTRMLRGNCFRQIPARRAVVLKLKLHRFDLLWICLRLRVRLFVQRKQRNLFYATKPQQNHESCRISTTTPQQIEPG